MRNTLCKIWNVARNRENVKNEKYTLWDMDYGEKTKKKYWKMRHKHCDTCHLARNTEKSAK